jgi:arylsulfatase A-like enzyme
MSWEGRIIPGIKYRSPVIAMDIFTTIAASTGCPLPPDREIDGKDLLPYIENESMVPHQHLFWQRGKSKAIRSGDWKVIWNEEFGDTLLYNIQIDPTETDDRYVKNKSLSLDLIQIHEKWSGSLSEPLWPPIVHFREMVDARWFYFDN